MKAIAPDDPIFGSENGALKFAFNYVHGSCKPGTLANLVGGMRLGKGLAGLDGAGQSGLILSALSSRLSPIRLQILTARYSIPSVRCECGAPCCREYRENPEWADAIKQVSEWILAQGATGTVSHYKLRRALVMRYFGTKSSYADIATQCGINRNTASEYQNKVTTLLKNEEMKARYEAEGIFKGAGLIE